MEKLFLLGFGALGVLVGGTQVADLVLGFFLGPLFVEIDEALEDFFFGEVGRPGVGVGYGAVEVVVELLEDGDEALFVDDFVFGAEGFAAAEFFEDVVHARHGQVGMLGLLPLAVGVQLLRQAGDAFPLLGRGVREGEGFETAGIVVAGIISHTHSATKNK